jgi:nucleoside-diphosphate-sugar epimerase
MEVLITGGTGFIGSRLALRSLERGDAVRVLGQENNPAERENRRLIESKGARIVLGSVTEREKMFDLTRGVDLVYHLAAAQHEANVPDQHFWDVNVTGVKNILEASLAAGVKRFVHGSTIGVYGSALEGEINEQSPLRPDNIYGVTKLEGEKVALSFQEKLPVVIIRISETYGPGDRRLLKLFKAIKKKIFFMIGNGENLHHLIYIDDLIDGMFLAAEVPGVIGKTFVLAGKEPLTTKKMVQVIADELGTSLPKVRAPLSAFLMLATIMEKMLRPLGIQPPLHRRRMDFFKKSFVFTQGEAARHLGFAPKYSFKQGVHETAKWYAETGAI